MNLIRSDLKQLTPEDFLEVKELAEKTKQSFKELIETLPEDKYPIDPIARTYIENLSQSVTAFFDIWFTNKAWIPLNTNAIESAFSQVKNPIWAVDKHWGEPGFMNWLKVAVKKVFIPCLWNQLWAEYLDIDSNLQINLLETRYQWV